MKKRFIATLLICLMMAGIPALAETSAKTTIYNGTVEYRNTLTLTAPFGGQLLNSVPHVGDQVKAGDALFTLGTTKVYATLDGTVRGLRAQNGDSSDTVQNRYSALLYLEPAGQYTVSATNAGAYKSDDNNNENRFINEGETVYLRCSQDNDRTGVGVITAVDGRNFTVEVQQSNLNVDDTVYIFRDGKFSTSSRLATNAKVARAASVPITASGSVFSLDVGEGDAVHKGDVLLETVTGTLYGLQPLSNTVTAPADGVVLSVAQQTGAVVTQDQVLATLYTQDDLRIAFTVDESELDTVRVGQQAKVTLDAFPGQDALGGTVESISAYNEDGAASYTVFLKLENAANLFVGMSASITLSAQ